MDNKQKPKKKTTLKKKSLTKSKKATKKKLNAESTKKKGKASRYNKIQKILSRYLKENNIKVGKDFNRIASSLNQKTKDSPLKYVEQHIAILYTEFYKMDAVEPFPESFPFYMLNQTITTSTFDNATISFSFDDGLMKTSISGDTVKVLEEFRTSGLYSHLRKYYDSSPTAMFVLKSEVGKSVVYAIETFQAPVEPQNKPISAPTTQKSGEVVVPYSASEVIAIEKEKQKTMKEVQKLLKQGFTKDEIFKLLGK
jgi:hypothetical protein